MKATKEKIESLVLEEIKNLIKEKGLTDEAATSIPGAATSGTRIPNIGDLDAVNLKKMIDFIGSSLVKSMYDKPDQLSMVTLFKQAGKEDLAKKAAMIRGQIEELLPELSALKALKK